jgi:hypothetical protein
LQGETDVFEDLRFGVVVELGVVLDLVDGPEAQVRRGNRFLHNRRQLHDWNVERSGSLLQNVECSLLLRVHI